MSKHGSKCGADCCHDKYCCPRGFVEHVQYYRYLREVTEEPYRITFTSYWWHEFKSLIGLNGAKDE